MIEAVTTQCCVAGGGPAGVMLGFLLAMMFSFVVGSPELGLDAGPF